MAKAKCGVCREHEALWAWQPYGPDEQEPGYFTTLGSHYRGFPVVKVCDTCAETIKSLQHVVHFTLKGVRYAWGPRARAFGVVASLEGHGIMHVEDVRWLCASLQVDMDDLLVMHWQSKEQAWERYRIHVYDEPGSGVGELELSYHLARELGLGAPGKGFVGVGFQTRANRDAIMAFLREKYGLEPAKEEEIAP